MPGHNMLIPSVLPSTEAKGYVAVTLSFTHFSDHQTAAFANAAV